MNADQPINDNVYINMNADQPINNNVYINALDNLHLDTNTTEDMHVESKADASKCVDDINEYELYVCVNMLRKAAMKYINTYSFVKAIRDTQKAWENSRLANLDQMDFNYHDIPTVLEDLILTIIYSKEEGILILTVDEESEKGKTYSGFVLGTMDVKTKIINMHDYGVYEVNTYDITNMLWFKIICNGDMQTEDTHE